MVEQRSHKSEAAGSIPAKATNGVSCTKAGEFALQADWMSSILICSTL